MNKNAGSSPKYMPLDDQVGNLREVQHAGSYRDMGYAVAFVIHYAAVVALAVMYNKSVDTSGGITVDDDVYHGLTASLGVAIGFALLWMALIRTCATCLLWAGILFSLVITGALLVWVIMQGIVTAIILIAFCMAIQLCWVYLVRDRIPMAAAMLEIASEIGQQFWGIYVASIFMMFTAAAGVAGWAYSAYCVFQSLDDENMQYGAGLGYIFSLFWIVSVFRYVVHSVGAGCTGVWYFQVSEADPSSHQISGAQPSLCRALTTSFGSICYGALIIAVIEVLQVLAQQLEESDNGLLKFVGCCLDCLLQCVQDIVEYINSYAFTFCAIYGDDYCAAVSKTMQLFSGNGWDLIINDDLIENVLALGAIGCGAASAGAGYLVAQASGDSDNDAVTCAIAGGVMGLGMISIVNAAVVSCVKSLYVCFAQDPLVLYNTKRSKYDKLQTAWLKRWPEGIPCQGYLNVAMSESRV